MSDESEYYCGEADLEDDEQGDCDYDFGTFCVEPQKRAIGCCFECWLFLEVDEADRKEAERRNKEVQAKMSRLMCCECGGDAVLLSDGTLHCEHCFPSSEEARKAQK